jgi:ABC-type uncharacterized transport system permease subunit
MTSADRYRGSSVLEVAIVALLGFALAFFVARDMYPGHLLVALGAAVAFGVLWGGLAWILRDFLRLVLEQLFLRFK